MELQIRLTTFLLCITGACTCAGASAGEMARVDADAEIRAAIEVARALPEDGINDDYLIELGGLEHRVSVRGASRDNPILLFLHGGPGTAMLPLAWTFQRSWEDYFTVVHWDQRGAGRTGFINGGMGDGRPITIAGMQQDAEDLIRHLLETYGQQKIFLLGHSWGSILGVRIARDHPEWLHAYIGVGQVVNSQANETASYRLALAEAERQGAYQALEGLGDLAPYPPEASPPSWEQTRDQRGWVVRLGGLTHSRAGRNLDRVQQVSPDYTDEEIAALKTLPGNTAAMLWPDLSEVSLDDVDRLEVPVIIFAGRYDMMTPSQVAADWFERMDAPLKRIFWFGKSAHYIVNEEPGVALYRLVRYALPLAGKTPEGN